MSAARPARPLYLTLSLFSANEYDAPTLRSLMRHLAQLAPPFRYSGLPDNLFAAATRLAQGEEVAAQVTAGGGAQTVSMTARTSGDWTALEVGLGAVDLDAASDFRPLTRLLGDAARIVEADFAALIVSGRESATLWTPSAESAWAVDSGPLLLWVRPAFAGAAATLRESAWRVEIDPHGGLVIVPRPFDEAAADEAHDRAVAGGGLSEILGEKLNELVETLQRRDPAEVQRELWHLLRTAAADPTISNAIEVATTRLVEAGEAFRAAKATRQSRPPESDRPRPPD